MLRRVNLVAKKHRDTLCLYMVSKTSLEDFQVKENFYADNCLLEQATYKNVSFLFTVCKKIFSKNHYTPSHKRKNILTAKIYLFAIYLYINNMPIHLLLDILKPDLRKNGLDPINYCKDVKCSNLLAWWH